MQAIMLTVMICQVGGPGDTAQAQPIVDKFLRQLEQAGGWQAQTLKGEYHNRLEDCQRSYQQHKPALVALDLPTYLGQRKDWQLRPLAHVGTPTAKRYYLLVQKGRYTRPKQLIGKKVVTALASNPAFIYRIVLDGKVPDGHFTLGPSRRPLKGLRQVARGQADATLVDEAAYRYLGELKLPRELVPIFVSRPLPGLTLGLSAYGARDKQLARRVTNALPKLCKGAGSELCKTFGVTSFVGVKAALYRRLAQRYGPQR